jgi:hypothetical protein
MTPARHVTNEFAGIALSAEARLKQMIPQIVVIAAARPTRE